MAAGEALDHPVASPVLLQALLGLLPPHSRWYSSQLLLLCQATLHFPHHTCLHALHTSSGLSPSARTDLNSTYLLSGGTAQRKSNTQPVL